MSQRYRIATLACALAVSLVQRAATADPPQPTAPPLSTKPGVPAFHRLFLPADEIDSRTWKQRYLPIDAAEFERELEIVADGARGAPSAQRVRVEQVSYTAELKGDDVLVGSARLELSPRDDQPALLSLVPCSLALESAAWLTPSKPAIVGADPQGLLRVLVEGSRLELHWSQRGERTASGAVNFRCDLPASPRSNLRLTVPQGAEVVADHGVVTKQGDGASAASIWNIELGGNHRVTIKIVPEEARGQRQPLTLLRQAMTYEFSSRGINVGSQLRLDVHGEPLERLAIDLDPGLHLIGAKFGELAIPWSATTDLQSEQTRVLLEFPEPLSGTGRVIQLSAVAPLATDNSFPLPQMYPRNVAWQEGTADLLIPSTLVLEQLSTSGCRESRVTALPAPLAGESIQLQFFEAAAKVEVRLAEPRQKLELRRATSLQISAEEIASRTTLAVAAQDGSRELLLPVRAGWSVDSVESLSPNRAIEWDLTESPDKSSQLKITVGDAERIAIQGHRAVPEGKSFEASQLQMLDGSSFASNSPLVSVKSVEGLDLRWTGAESVEPLDAATLTAEQQALLQASGDASVFLDDERFAQATLSLERSKPSYAADIHIDAVVQQESLTETFKILCTPEAARVERLLIHFTQPREVPLEWSLAGGNNSGQFSARKLTAGEQAEAGVRGAGEVWELLLQLTRPGAFELRGQRTVPFKAETPLALVSVHEAITQRGTLAIRALGESGLTINNRGLMSVPAELLDDDRYQTARATYHYQPSGDDLGDESIVSIAPAPAVQSETGAWAWVVDLNSRFAADGVASHQATIRIETGGRRRVKVTLPGDVKLHAVAVDAQPLSASTLPKDGAAWTVELPSGRSQATLTLGYSTTTALPGLEAVCEPVFPTLDIPAVNRRWTVCLPPEYRIGDVSGTAQLNELPPLTWSQRLFGPMGRNLGAHVFNPFLPSDWREVFSARSRAEESRQLGEQFVLNLGTFLGDYQDGEELTWGQLLFAAGEAESQVGRTLLIDADGLRLAGITPQTRVNAAAETRPQDRGHGTLREAGLVIVVSPGALLLTTTQQTARLDESSLARGTLSTTAIARGRLAERLRRTVGEQTDAAYQGLALWLASADSPTELGSWPVPADAMSAIDPGQWHAYSLQCGTTNLPSVRVMHTARMRSLVWAVFLGIVALGLWRPAARPWGLLALLATAAAVALLVPATYAPVASAVILATLCCLAARLLRFEPPKAPQNDKSRSTRKPTSSIVQPVSVALLMAALFNTAAALDAAAPDDGSEKLPIYTVLVPTGADQQPVGGKYYVPDTLYESLLRQAAIVSGRPQDWILVRSRFHGALTRDPVTSRLGLAKLSVRFDFEVFQDNVGIQIPLSQEAWAPGLMSARLDGKQLPPAWNATGSALILGQQSIGPHRVELEILPTLVSEPRRTGFDLPIPKLSQATLELTLPQDVANVEVPTAAGHVITNGERGELLAQLGTADRLSVRWPSASGEAEATPNLEVEELVWIKVRPGTTVLDARFKYKVLSGRVRTLRLLTDPRLRLLTSPTAPSPIAAVHTIPGDPQRVELELGEAVSKEVVVDLSFLVTDASGVGNLRLPRLEATDARSARRLLGVTVDPALEHRVQAGEDSRSVEVSEYSAHWGAADAPPQRAYSIPRGEPIWFLATQPNEPAMTVEQVTALGLGKLGATVRLDATLTISRGVLAQLTILGPRGFTIDQVSVRDDEVERVARWSANHDGRISVFLTAPIEGRQQLVLRGRWRPDPENAGEIPQWKVLAATENRSQLELYRQPGVLVSIEAPPGATAVEVPASERQTSLGSLCGAYQVAADGAAFRVRQTPNEPQLRAVATTLLERDSDRWTAELQFHVNVTEGLVDSLQFEIPPQWSDPFRVEPETPLSIKTLAGEQRRRLTLTPAKPLSGKHVFKIRGRVAPSPGDRLSVPEIEPLHTTTLQRFIVLPRKIDAQQVTWDALRLSPARLPADMQSRGWKPDTVSVYEVTGEHFQASLKAVQRERAAALVKLLDVQLAWLPDGGYSCAATFDVEPGGATHCELAMPPGTTVTHAAIERLPASLKDLGKGRMRIALGPQQLPQRIELLYSGSARNTTRLQPPLLIDVKVMQTLWTVYGGPNLIMLPASAEQRVNAAEQHLIRLENIASLVELPAEVVGEHLPEEIARWYEGWRKRYGADRRALRLELIAAGREAVQSEESITARRLDQQMATIDDRLAAPQGGLHPVQLSSVQSRFADAFGGELFAQHFALRDPSGVLPISFSSTAHERGVANWLAAAALFGVATVVCWRLRNRQMPKLNPWTVAASAAFAWWLLLAPSFLGFFVLVAIAALRIWGGDFGPPRPRPA